MGAVEAPHSSPCILLSTCAISLAVSCDQRETSLIPLRRGEPVVPALIMPECSLSTLSRPPTPHTHTIQQSCWIMEVGLGGSSDSSFSVFAAELACVFHP